MLIEGGFDIVVHSVMIRHSWCRSVTSMIVTVFSGLITYSYLPHKRSVVPDNVVNMNVTHMFIYQKTAYTLR